jgi:hypothetical protein
MSISVLKALLSRVHRVSIWMTRSSGHMIIGVFRMLDGGAIPYTLVWRYLGWMWSILKLCDVPMYG